jgi:ATP-dependent HslUV protease subunit HslV
MKIRGTTIVAVKRNGRITVAGDGQVTLDTTILKHGARKVRRLYNNEVIVGFAGATPTHLLFLTDLIRNWNNTMEIY